MNLLNVSKTYFLLFFIYNFTFSFFLMKILEISYIQLLFWCTIKKYRRLMEMWKGSLSRHLPSIFSLWSQPINYTQTSKYSEESKQNWIQLLKSEIPYLWTTVAIIDAEKVYRGDFSGCFRTGSRTASDVIALVGHERWFNGDSVFHLSPSPDHRSEPPRYSLIIPPNALLPHRYRHIQPASGRRLEKPGNYSFRR